MKTTFNGRSSGVLIDTPVLAASLALNILSMLTPIVILLIFSRVIPFQSTATLQMLTLAMLVAATMELLLRWSRSVLLHSAAENAAVENNQTFLRNVLRANTTAFAGESKAVHLERYAAVARLRDHYSGQNQTLVIDLPFTAIFIVMVGLVGGWLVLVPLGTLFGVLIFAAMFKTSQSKIFEDRKLLDARRYAFLSEVFAKMATVKANTMERQMTRRFELLEDQTVESSHKLIRFVGFAQSYGAVFSQCAVGAMGILGAYLVIQQTIGIAELAACMLLNGRITQPLMRVMTVWVQSESLAMAKSKLADISKIPTSHDHKIQREVLDGELEVVDVAMTHPYSDEQLLAGLSFKAAAGRTLLLDGTNTWAVAALFDAISGQRSVDTGRILIDGFDQEDISAKKGQGGLVVLEENPAILAGTLLQNMSAFGDAERIERAKNIAAQLGLEKRIHRLPLGYNTVVNQGSAFDRDPVNRQLIALVRCLSLQPKILLMNEPTAILDTPEREALSACLQALDPRPTLVIRSPDPRMKRLADASIDLSTIKPSDLQMWEQDAKDDTDTASILKRDLA